MREGGGQKCEPERTKVPRGKDADDRSTMDARTADESYDRA